MQGGGVGLQLIELLAEELGAELQGPVGFFCVGVSLIST